MPKKFASLLAPACFAFLLFAAAGSASAQQDPCDPATDPNQCIVTGSDPNPTNPHAMPGGSVTGGSSSSGVAGEGMSVTFNEDSQSANEFYMLLLMYSGLA